jgi:hypothetical protein
VKNRIISISFAAVLTLSAGLVGCGAEGIPEIAEYSLTISSTEGGEVIAPGEGTFAYYSEAVVELVARPASGYRFVNWSGDVYDIVDVNAASTTITMNGDYSVIANFEVIGSAQYSLTISSTVGGSVTTPGEGTFSYDGGMAVNLVATPDSGYQFVSWTGNVHTIADVNAASITITMNDAGAVVDLAVDNEEGYKFFEWTGDIETIANVNATSTTWHNQPPMHFSITMEGNYGITAHFIPRWFIPTG